MIATYTSRRLQLVVEASMCIYILIGPPPTLSATAEYTVAYQLSYGIIWHNLQLCTVSHDTYYIMVEEYFAK